MYRTVCTYIAQHGKVPMYSTVCTVQHRTVQFRTMLSVYDGTVQYSTARYLLYVRWMYCMYCTVCTICTVCTAVPYCFMAWHGGELISVRSCERFLILDSCLIPA